MIHQIRIAKRQEAVPLTRAYIEAAEFSLRAREVSARRSAVTDLSEAKTEPA